MGPGLHFLYSSLVLALRKKKCLRKAVQRVYALHSLKVYKAGKTACLSCSPVGSRSELDSFAQTQQLSAKRHLRHKDVDFVLERICNASSVRSQRNRVCVTFGNQNELQGQNELRCNMFVTRNDVKVPEGCRRSARPVKDQCMSTGSGRTLPFLGPFASLSSAAMNHLPRSNNKCKKEQGTGMEFPEECCVLTDKNCPVLTGFGQACLLTAQLTHSLQLRSSSMMLQGAKQKADGNEEHQRCALARAQQHGT